VQRLRPHFELLFWIAALIALGFSNPAQTHFVLCPLRLMGFPWCPGCGIGHAIAFLLHGNVKASLHAHWLGIPALIILLYRIYTLLTRPNYTFGETKAN
jgi:hypothetical protein